MSDSEDDNKPLTVVAKKSKRVISEDDDEEKDATPSKSRGDSIATPNHKSSEKAAPRLASPQAVKQEKSENPSDGKGSSTASSSKTSTRPSSSSATSAKQASAKPSTKPTPSPESKQTTPSSSAKQATPSSESKQTTPSPSIKPATSSSESKQAPAVKKEVSSTPTVKKEVSSTPAVKKETASTPAVKKEASSAPKQSESSKQQATPSGSKQSTGTKAQKVSSPSAAKDTNGKQGSGQSSGTQAPPKSSNSNKTSSSSSSSQESTEAKPKIAKPQESTAPAKRKRDEGAASPKSPKRVKKESQVEEEDDSESESSTSSSEEDDSSSGDSSESESGTSSSSSSSSSSSEEEEDDLPLNQLTRKRKRPEPARKKASTPKQAKRKSPTTKQPEKSKSRSSKKDKEEEDGEKKEKRSKRKKEDEEPLYKWWLEDPLPEGKKWKTLEHNGVLFPPEYEPHGVPLIYDGQEVELTPEQEELATYFSMYIESDHVKKPQFLTNFFNEFKKVLNPKGSKTKHIITEFKKCDFSKIREHLLKEREARKNRSKEEKQAEKEEKEKLQEKYGYAIVDGYKQKIANYRVEPPGLFLGRGDHPKAGMLKRRIQPEDVTLNLGKKAAVPECPVQGHKWGKIIHNDEVSWLAMWKDNINDHFKYVWLAPSSRIKGEADRRKFETARNLKNHIDSIRKTYTKELRSKDDRIRQRATALYLIDHLALRVGNEKDEDEADTVGCCSLRVEHIKLEEPNIVEFDFLGKDSMRYQNSVEVDENVYNNIKSFMKSKKPKDELFDQLTVSALNSHLKSQMDGLTAKVFRTYNASICLENELKKSETGEKRLVDEEILCYNRANREVAILCNHQRSVSKNFGEQISKIDEKIEELEDQLDELKEHLKNLKAGRPTKKRKKDDSDDEDGKKKRRLSDDPEKVKEQISKLKEKIKIWETKKTEKDETKAVALSTSKINYIDPRISVAWAKRVGVPLEKIFSKALRQKFPWAMDVDEDYAF